MSVLDYRQFLLKRVACRVPAPGILYPRGGADTSSRANVDDRWMGITTSPDPPSENTGSSPTCTAAVSNFISDHVPESVILHPFIIENRGKIIAAGIR